MEKLTPKQEEILTFIKEYVVKYGYPPTIREIGAAVGTSSPATVHVHLANIENKGFIKRQGTKNRAIEILVENEFAKAQNNVVEVLGSYFFIKFNSSINDSVSLPTTTYSKSTISLTNLAVLPKCLPLK